MPDPKLQIILAAKDITGAALTKFQGRITAITKSVFSFRGALGALTGAGGFGLLITKSIETADAIGKTADKLGVTTTALQEYRYAAERSGVETKTLDMALQRFTRRTAEAAQGKGELRGVLEQYNIAVRDAAGNTRATEAVFRDLADVIQRTTDPAERLRIAFKAFDSEGAALVNMLRDGSAGLEAFGEKARGLGVILDDDLIRGSENAKDAMDDLGKVIQVNFSKVVLENVESITAAVETLANAMSKVAKYAGLRGISGTFAQGAKLAREGKIDWEKFYKAGFFERQRMVDEALGGAQTTFEGPSIVRRKIPPPAGPTVIPPARSPAIPPWQDKTSMKYDTMAPGDVYDRTMGVELSRFAQYDTLVRDSEKAYEDMTGHVREYAEYTGGAYESIDSRISTSFSHASDALSEFVTSGKVDFKGFADSLIGDLVRIQARMVMSGLLSGLTSVFTSGLPSTIRGGAGGGYGFDAGGHIGEPVAGIGLQSGRSYEFHANETVIPDSRLGGGGANIEININNQSGTSLEAETQTIRQDPEKMVADIIIKRKMTNRRFRDALRS